MDFFQFWDVANYGAFFTLNFPEKPTGYLEGSCLSGEWTIIKIEEILMVGFKKEDLALVIPHIGSHIAAIAMSSTCQYTYHLTRQAVREIIEWAEREGIQPKAHGQKRLEVTPVAIEAGP